MRLNKADSARQNMISSAPYTHDWLYSTFYQDVQRLHKYCAEKGLQTIKVMPRKAEYYNPKNNLGV